MTTNTGSAGQAPETPSVAAKPKKLRVVHGEVTSVRAVPSREVSVITVEVPDNFHVEVTAMLYGKDAIVVCSELGDAYPYGVISPEDAPTQGSSQSDAQARDPARPPAQPGTIHGLISTIRPFPSRGITQISVEIPILFHIDATNMLHGLNALVVPASLPRNTPYGVLPSAGEAPDGAERGTTQHAQRRTPVQSAGAPVAPVRAAVASRGDRPPMGFGSGRGQALGLSNRADVIVATRWLGARCATAEFQDWLKVRTEAAARDRVCEICGVESRAEIQASAKATEAFLTLIVQPFEARIVEAPSGPTMDEVVGHEAALAAGGDNLSDRNERNDREIREAP